MGDVPMLPGLRRACAGMDTVLHLAGSRMPDAAATPEFAARHWAVNAAEGTFHLLDRGPWWLEFNGSFFSAVSRRSASRERTVSMNSGTRHRIPLMGVPSALPRSDCSLGSARPVCTRVNLRPALVYGPGMKANLPRLIAAVRRGWLPPLPEPAIAARWCTSMMWCRRCWPLRIPLPQVKAIS